MSSPSNSTLPEVMSSMRSTARPVVDLPQPDSPTSPRVSPRRTVKLMPSTAFTVPTRRLARMPDVIGKWTLRSSTVRTGSGSETGMEEAGREMVGLAFEQRRTLGATEIGRILAARREGAARRQGGQIGRLALDRDQRP